MAEKSSVLYCEYVIDGVAQGVSPGRMLDECLIDIPAVPHETSGKIVDETVDLAPSTYKFDSALIMTYLDLVKKQLEKKRHVPIHFADSYAAGKVAESLLDAIWMTGHFRMGDLTLKGDWHWDREPIGNMAAFYRSVEAATGYIDELGVRLRSYSVLSGQCSISFKAATTSEEEVTEDEEEIIIRELPFKTANPRIGRRRKCPSTFRTDSTDWLIYIPFDQCDYRLGGSLLAEATGSRSALAPDISDADYFIDCYEVVRELVEDGVVKAGTTVFEGGLMTALDRMLTEEVGASVSIDDIRRAYSDEKPVRILFAEVPGVIIEIADIDYDYVDAELLLQDIAYFPLGHPNTKSKGLSVSTGEKPAISSILESLLKSQTSEGED